MKGLAMALGIVVGVPASAAADERGTFVTLDRMATTGAVGLEASAFLYTPSFGGPGFALRENLHARYVDAGGFGAYGQFAVSEAVGGDSSSDLAASNVELGGLYAVKLDGADLLLRLGIGIPSAPTDRGAAEVNQVTAIGRWQDLVLIGPDTLWLRPGLVLRAGARELFAQADLGVDFRIRVGDRGSTLAFFHGNAGIGTAQGPVALTAELATVAYDGPRSPSADDRGITFYHSVGASIRYVGGG